MPTGSTGRGATSSTPSSSGSVRTTSGSGGGGAGGAGGTTGRIAVSKAGSGAAMATGSGSGASMAAGSGANSGPLSGANRNAITSQIAKDRQGSAQKQMTNIGSLYDLINSSVSVPSGTSGAAGGQSGQSQTMNLPSPLKDPNQQESLLPLLLDKVTTSKSKDSPGRINVNTASQAVLTTLKAIATTLSDTDIQNIVAQRPAPSSADWTDPIFQTPTWLVTRAKLSPTVVKSLEKYITTRTQVYRVQSIGYFDQDGPAARIEAVIDTNKGRPRILMWRDISELGKGYDVQSQSSQ